MACAALLHDTVEDHAEDIAPGGTRRAAFAILAGQFGGRTAELAAAVTNPVYAPGRDKHQQYREHVIASLDASPRARVIKASDFTGNAVGLFHTTGPKLPELARKYRPLAPVLREFIPPPRHPARPRRQAHDRRPARQCRGPVRRHRGLTRRRKRGSRAARRCAMRRWVCAGR